MPSATSDYDRVTFPPVAHLDTVSSSPIRAQPVPSPHMAIRQPIEHPATSRAERIRGGCVPCPDGSICYIIPLPCFCC
ncbi:hypothetical protein A0H81_13693 [Grifola frondosa]|uniref:Uncharacterized protein n=1 Tax=Grifola frondosa TaxID=5627 RepID=A0A1C7LUB3_GRIFR|nr:hypothetical protein A0H81_13693 [Grifola frondosa]